MINSLWQHIALAVVMKRRNVTVLDQQLLPSQPRLPSLALHTSFTAHSLAFCDESVCQSVCARERSLLQSFKGPNNGVSQPVPPQRGQLWRSWNKEEPSEMFTCSPQGSLSLKTATVAPCWPLYTVLCCVPPSPSLTTSCSCCAAGVILQADISHFFAWLGNGHPDKKAAGAGPHHLRKWAT